LLEGFFGEDDAEGIADFANFGLRDYGITLVTTWLMSIGGGVRFCRLQDGFSKDCQWLARVL
jgi:hypothetical protein